MTPVRYILVAIAVAAAFAAGVIASRYGRPPAPTEIVISPRVEPAGETADAAPRPLGTCPSGMAAIPGGTLWQGAIADLPPGSDAEVAVPEFCIDVYEYPNRHHGMPRTHVNLAEARALCERESKHLCSEAEWLMACSGPSARPYSYGELRERWRCNTDGVTPGDALFIAPSGSHPGCRNEFGVFDLNGNVSEIVDGYSSIGGQMVVRGGTAWVGYQYGQSCYSRHTHPKDDAGWSDDGFRCCKDVE